MFGLAIVLVEMTCSMASGRLAATSSSLLLMMFEVTDITSEREKEREREGGTTRKEQMIMIINYFTQIFCVNRLKKSRIEQGKRGRIKKKKHTYEVFDSKDECMVVCYSTSGGNHRHP